MGSIKKMTCTDCGNENASLVIYDKRIDKGENLFYVVNKDLEVISSNLISSETHFNLKNCIKSKDIRNVVGGCLGECDDFDMEIVLELDDGSSLNTLEQEKEILSLTRSLCKQQ